MWVDDIHLKEQSDSSRSASIWEILFFGVSTMESVLMTTISPILSKERLRVVVQR